MDQARNSQALESAALDFNKPAPPKMTLLCVPKRRGALASAAAV